MRNIILGMGLFVTVLARVACGAAGEADASAGTAGAVDGLSISTLTNRIAEVKTMLERLDLECHAVTTELSRTMLERQSLLCDVAHMCGQQIDQWNRLQRARAARAAAARRNTEWTGPATPPPYSILLADQARDAVATAKQCIDALASQHAIIISTIEGRNEQLRKLDQDIRLTQERAEQGAAGSDSGGAEAEMHLAELRREGAADFLAVLSLNQANAEEQLANERLNLEFAQCQIASFGTNVVFTPDDLAAVLKATAGERQGVARDQAACTAQEATLGTRVAAAEQALDRTRIACTGAVAAAHVAALEHDREIALAELETAQTRQYALAMLDDILTDKRDAWERRFALYNNPSPQLKVEMRQLLTQRLQMARSFQTYMRQKNIANVSRLRDLENAKVNATDMAYLGSLRATYLQRDDTLRRLDMQIAGLIELLNRAMDEAGAAASETKSEQVADWWAEAKSMMRTFLDFEIVAVQDNIVVEGRTISGKRSVTIGKVLEALLLIVLAYAASMWIGHLYHRVTVRVLRSNPYRAHVLRRWVQILVLALLIIVIMFWVKIPIEVFAFIGGAAAIGIGFGMQNMLKNLISGVLIIADRPFEVGDYIEVCGVRGEVISIGIRLSTVRNLDGIETIIPNSEFVEKVVTNWTHSDRQVRFTIKIGVAYGSDTDKVTTILADVAGRHPGVLKEPAPEALFQDFGPDALEFTLCYWIELRQEALGVKVASEIRHMINKALANAGIAIAYPQRDIHLDSRAPIKVEMIGGR